MEAYAEEWSKEASCAHTEHPDVAMMLLLVGAAFRLGGHGLSHKASPDWLFLVMWGAVLNRRILDIGCVKEVGSFHSDNHTPGVCICIVEERSNCSEIRAAASWFLAACRLGKSTLLTAP